MNPDLLNRFQSTLNSRTGRTWEAKVSIPTVTLTVYINIDGRTAYTSVPVAAEMIEDDFDAAIEWVIRVATDNIGALALDGRG